MANVDRDEPLTTETAREMELLTVELEAVSAQHCSPLLFQCLK